MRRATISVLAAAVASAITGCAGSVPATSTSASGSSSATAVAEQSPAPGGSTSPQTTSGRTTQGPWGRPNDQERLVKAAQLVLRPRESLAVHYHSHLNVVVDGEAVPVPAGLGIKVSADGAPPHGGPGIAPLHTHDLSGVLHIEAPKADRFTLGQAFTLWDVALGKGRVGGYVDGQNGRHVNVFVDGKQYARNPRQMTLSEHLDIDIVITRGATKPTVPKPYDWSTF